MPLYSYDLHIHTCLSPCGDSEMTPPNIANMAHLKDLDIIAITDHNSARNARAVIKAAEGLPLVVIPGIEVTTAEEIHMVCLFPDAEAAERAGIFFESLLPPVENRPGYFGAQQIMDENERLLGEFPYLLPNALGISIDVLPETVAGFGGFCYPAHIDRPANSLLAVFGSLPEEPLFKTLEVFRPELFFSEQERLRYQESHIIVSSSDAHRLPDIHERERFLELDRPDFTSLKKALAYA